MNFKIFRDRRSMGKAAAEQAAAAIRSAIRHHGSARIVAATAASQKEFLEELASAPQLTGGWWKPSTWMNISG